MTRPAPASRDLAVRESAVRELPVRALAMRSRPARASGRLAAWMGVIWV